MAVYLINRSVNANSGKLTPEEIWTGNKIDLFHVKLFGSQVMVHIPKEKRRKLDYKSKKLIFVGYDSNTKGYRCIDRQTRKLIISRDVVFLEENTTSTVRINLNNDDLEEVRDNEPTGGIIIDNNQKPTEREDQRPPNTPTNSPRNDEVFGTPERTMSDSSVESPTDQNDPDYEPDEQINPKIWFEKIVHKYGNYDMVHVSLICMQTLHSCAMMNYRSNAMKHCIIKTRSAFVK